MANLQTLRHRRTELQRLVSLMLESFWNLRKGDRIKLISTDDPYTKLQAGDLGTISRIDAVGTIHVNWDSGSNLGLIPSRDEWVLVSQDLPA